MDSSWRETLEYKGKTYAITDILALAGDEHFMMTRCDACGGPEIHSKLQPMCRCLRCWFVRRLEEVTKADQRFRCKACSCLFWALERQPECQKCTHERAAKEARATARDRQRELRRSVVA